MATSLQGLRSTVTSCVCSQSLHRNAANFIGLGRAFSTTLQRSKRTSRPARALLAKVKRSGNPRAARLLEIERKLRQVRRAEDKDNPFAQGHQRIDAMVRPHELAQVRRKKLKETFMNMGEKEPWEDEWTMEDEDDDMNSLAHGELEQHREMRHYARLAAWEMPLLSKLAKPFQPPTRDMPLRFRYTTYMGEQHPAEKKVVLEFSPADMPGLTEEQATKLRKLVGVRYNPEKDIDPTDTFEDIPLDTRHHHFNPKPKFPKEWAVTEERRQQLEKYRQAAVLKDQKREITGRLIDGVKQIQEELRRKPKDLGDLLPEPVLAGRGKKPIPYAMSSVKIAPFEATPVESISSTEPLGTVLVIGAYNFPIQLSLGPLIGAIAAGCTGILKPSEVSPASAMVMKKIVEEYLDPSAYALVNGAIPETTALLDEKWDKIFYTGGAGVGTIIAKKAAETLTPITLELGGRNPAIVTKNADPRLAARRLVWGKIHNAGQVCISQNYIMVEKEILSAFVEQLKIAFKEFYPNGQKSSPDYARIVNNRHFRRIKKMVDDSRGKILIGGEMDEAENFIEMTVVQVDDVKDSMIVDESFGPLIPLLAIENVEEAISIANSVHSTPLGLYPFGTKAETDKILNEVTSGGASVNDAFFHGSIPTLAFGGVGDSGQGAYRGKASFDTFTHRRSVTTTPGWMEKLIDVRYPPYDGKLKKFRQMSEMKPNFDRDGREIKGLGYWAGFVLNLGGSSTKGALLRWALAALVVLGTRKFLFNNGLPSWIR
ncbi:hypothetical protein JHW43_006597 [Diplocarpon mali]|nr:hypothetical protein JHW43_006597 [Diplocarpon mali]